MIKLPFKKSSSAKTPKFLTIDVSSDNVKCLAFYKENGHLKIVGSGKVLLEPGSVRNGVLIDLGQVIRSAEEALGLSKQNVEDEIKNAIVGVSSDLCLENVTTAKITRGVTLPITNREVENFSQKITDSSSQQIKEYKAQISGDREANFQLIASSVVYASLDGKRVEGLEEGAGQAVEMALYTAFCPTHHIGAVQKLGKRLKLNVLAISPINFALLKALKHTELEHNDLVLVQVGADFTNVGVAFGGAIIKNKSLPIGYKHFVSEIGRIMGLTYNEAAKVVQTHSRGALTPSESVVVQSCLEDVLAFWLQGFELIFTNFPGVKTFPSDLYLFGEGIQLPEIKAALDKNQWSAKLPFKSQPKIKEVQLADLTKVSDSTGALISPEWIPLAALSYIYEEVA